MIPDKHRSFWLASGFAILVLAQVLTTTAIFVRFEVTPRDVLGEVKILQGRLQQLHRHAGRETWSVEDHLTWESDLYRQNPQLTPAVLPDVQPYLKGERDD